MVNSVIDIPWLIKSWKSSGCWNNTKHEHTLNDAQSHKYEKDNKDMHPTYPGKTLTKRQCVPKTN